ncbi:MAG: GntR family transcriptional regulator [Anaerolineales bacterium]
MTKTNAEKAYEFILEKIITVELEPGSVIEEQKLMKECNFGRTPVREALKRLQAEKYITVSPRRGMFVAPITYTDINRIYEIRVEMEAFGIRLSAERITGQQIATIQAYLDDYQDTSNYIVQEQISIDRKFHFLTYEATHNILLIADLKRYYNMSQRIWFFGYDSIDSSWIGLNDHQDILNALKQKNPDKAEKRIRNHIKNFQKHIQDYLF